MERYSQMSGALAYCSNHNKNSFRLNEFIALFREEAGLRRSIDKIYEIIVYALFSAITEAMELEVEVSYNPEKSGLLQEFQDFTTNILNISADQHLFRTKAKIYRVGLTNAADRGLDMWANFGLAIQIKHLSLNEELAEDIVHSVSADRIVIICKNAEEKVIVSLLHQIGWKSRIQAIVTEQNLIEWYEKSLRGQYSGVLGNKVLNILGAEIKAEFPSAQHTELYNFLQKRGYTELTDSLWNIS